MEHIQDISKSLVRLNYYCVDRMFSKRPVALIGRGLSSAFSLFCHRWRVLFKFSDNELTVVSSF